MIKIREAKRRDYAAIQEMYKKQALNYVLPDLDRDDLILKVVLEDDAKVEMAVLLRMTAETFFLVGDAGTRKQRLGKMLALQQAVSPEAKSLGICDAFCWVPPEIDARFGPLLLHVGWKKPEWPSYYKDL